MSPATQAMLIAALLRKPWQAGWQPAEVITELGYTPMTLSRAVKELTTAGIATLHNEGRARRLHMERSAAETWEHAKPLLRNPVKRHVWAHPIPKLKPPHVRLAGLSALARFSLLSEPQWPVYALSPVQWKAATQAGVEMLGARNIRKHANDVMRLSQLPAPETRIPLAARIGDDLNRFLDGLAADRSIDPKSLKLNNTVAEIVQRIALAYELKLGGTR